MVNTLDRLKILINSSTPIVVMETLEEMRAVGLARTACADLNIAIFEWSIGWIVPVGQQRACDSRGGSSDANQCGLASG